MWDRSWIAGRNPLGLVNHLTGKVALSARVNPKISIFKNLGGHLPIIYFD